MKSIIDTHNHLWKCEGEHFSWILEGSVIRRDFSIEELKQTLLAHGVSGSVLVQAVPTLEESCWLLEIARQEPLVKAVVGWVDVAAGAAAVDKGLDLLLQCSSKLKGIRYMSQGLPPGHLFDDDFVEGVRAIGARGLVYELLIKAGQLDAAERLIECCPQVSFVIEHIAKPDIRHHVIEPWRSSIARIAQRHANVSCKLSGMVTEADHENWVEADIEPYMTVVFDAFGPDRVMFGSDWPVSLLAADYGRLVSLCDSHLRSHPGIDRDKFYALNAERIYGVVG